MPYQRPTAPCAYCGSTRSVREVRVSTGVVYCQQLRACNERRVARAQALHQARRQERQG